MKNPKDFLSGTMPFKRGYTTDCPVWPYLSYYIFHIEEQFPKSCENDETFKSTVINGFVTNLAARLTNAANNVLVTEKIIFEKTTCSKMETSAYFKLISENKNYLLDIISAYPELDRVLTKLSKNFIEFTAQLILALIEDRQDINKKFNISTGTKLSSVEVSSSETHNGSRTVCILSFDSIKIVYKPRNLELEAEASDLLLHLSNAAGDDYENWKLPRYLVKKEHGWSEHTPQTQAESEAEVSSYFKRAGFLLGYCTTFMAADITSDNLIAHGPSPIPIDLETIFYSTLNIETIPKEVRWNVTQTSILPNWTWKGTDGIGVDLSALGGLSEQYVSLNLYQHLEDECGQSQFGMDGVKIFPNQNVLHINGKAAKPWDYEKEIIEGLNKLFSLVNSSQASILKIIESLRGRRNRYIPRPTATYHYAIQCSLHATLMRCTKKRTAFLENILNNDTAPAIGFLNAEIAACLDLDVPFAQGLTGALEFFEPRYDGSGYLDSNDYINGIDNSLQYVQTMSKNRVAFEEKLIANTLLAMKNMYEHGDKLTDHTFRQHDDLNDPRYSNVDEILNKLRSSSEINAKLINEMLGSEISTNGLWLGFHSSPGGYMEFSELGDDFYYGLSGILYGCVVATSRRSAIDKNLVSELLNACYSRVIQKLSNKGTHLGGFHFGLSSAIIPLLISLDYFDDERENELLQLYKRYVEEVLIEPWWQKYFWGSDFLSGMFGTLNVLTHLFSLTKDKHFSDLAKSLYDKLETELTPIAGRKLATFDNAVTTRSDALLSGLSHGIMGCAYSLFYFNDLIAQDDSVNNLFLGFLSWELDQYDETIENWHDYRKRSASGAGEFSWSHGLPGNYLAIDYFAQNGVPLAIEFLEKRPPKTVFSYCDLEKRKRPINDSLCHGAYGILNIIKKLSPESLNDPKIFLWSNVINLSEQSSRELRTKTADPLGLWIGRVGSLIGAIGLIEHDYEFPFLPHQMEFLNS
ncbi:type 2 lanthipeptide synthetase LanM [Pseudomonas moraviensis]|uniref:type 2 lanthipeptide synthetase LanM n=1 Tax=Pseudomonas moraviensis TaxID=321662 RepID=UPI0020937AB3|nr:type 2 lanthipeptide synthetase LanM [Pseudomonas moraviensis]UST69176.1 type 2 lanthipeptide synthetase LanM [Pseudomonas moraviensis]